LYPSPRAKQAPFTALLIFVLIAPALAQGSYEMPSKVDPKARYLFYLHGRIVERGRRPKSEDYGFYEYDQILETFRGRGFVVISEQRPMGTDIEKYAAKVTEQIRKLIKSGVPPAQITVTGASQGSLIAMLVSTYLKNRSLKFVLIAGCSENAELLNMVNLHGNVLSIYERTDGAGTCEKLRADATGLDQYEEMKLNTGLRHGFIYRPMTEWIEPTIAWARK
jgi:hypothetical protein